MPNSLGKEMKMFLTCSGRLDLYEAEISKCSVLDELLEIGMNDQNNITSCGPMIQKIQLGHEKNCSI